MRISIDVILDGDKNDDTNEEIALDAFIFQHKVIALIIALQNNTTFNLKLSYVNCQTLKDLHSIVTQ